jgi:DDB1- and CUL4-associated factor 13
VQLHRNLDPNLHQQERAHEYTRALNAVKLSKTFAKPFLAAFAHEDGVTCLAKNKQRVNSLLAGCADGELRLWDVARRRSLRRLVGHTQAVTGVSVTADGENCVSSSTDGSVRLWKVPFALFETGDVLDDIAETLSFRAKGALHAIDHHWRDERFATGGHTVDVWDHGRTQPIHSFHWGSDAACAVRFNPAEPELLASTGGDRSVALYDLRMATPLRKIVMQTKSNALAWNPMEPFNFVVANEDTCLYSYDMRNLKTSTSVHRDFVSAVMDVDFSPTGKEFVAGSYDRTVRIFPSRGGHSRECYHTKRMQRVFAVQYSVDATYIYSGSDDMNVRMWKAQAGEQLGTRLPQERHAQAYQQALIKRYEHMPEVRRIGRDKPLPRQIKKARKLRVVMEDAERRRRTNRIEHSAPGTVEVKPLRKKKIIAELE